MKQSAPDYRKKFTLIELLIKITCQIYLYAVY